MRAPWMFKRTGYDESALPCFQFIAAKNSPVTQKFMLNNVFSINGGNDGIKTSQLPPNDGLYYGS